MFHSLELFTYIFTLFTLLRLTCLRCDTRRECSCHHLNAISWIDYCNAVLASVHDVYLQKRHGVIKSQTPLRGHRLRTPATDTTNGQAHKSQQFYNKFATSQCQSPTSRHVKMLGCGKFLFVGGACSWCL